MPQPPSSAPGPNNFKELFSFRLNVLTHRMSQLAALVNQAAFDLDPREWRILGLLGTTAPLSLQALANEVAVESSKLLSSGDFDNILNSQEERDKYIGRIADAGEEGQLERSEEALQRGVVVG